MQAIIGRRYCSAENKLPMYGVLTMQLNESTTLQVGGFVSPCREIRACYQKPLVDALGVLARGARFWVGAQADINAEWALHLQPSVIWPWSGALAPCWRSLHEGKKRVHPCVGASPCKRCVFLLVCGRPPSHLFRSSLQHFLFMPRETSTDTAPTKYLLCCQPDTKPLLFSRNTFAAKCATLHTPHASASTVTHRSASSPCLQRPTFEVDFFYARIVDLDAH